MGGVPAEWRTAERGEAPPREMREIAWAYPVTMRVREGRRPGSADRGWLSFVDGTLCYWSRRTEFGFRRSGREARWRGRGFGVTLEDGRNVRFVPRLGFLRRRESRGFEEEFFRWCADPRGGRADRLPPLGPRPSRLAAWLRLLRR